MANIIDSATCILMVLLIVCVAMATNYEEDEDLLGNAAAIILAAVFGVVVVAVSISGHRYFRPRPFFPRLICHHKAQAAAQARYIQTLLVMHSGQLCFIDSDYMATAEELLDIVRCRIGTLIVYLTSDTLRRPWCACEITLARLLHRPTTAIYHPTFTTPELKDISPDAISHFLVPTDIKLVEFGVTDELIAIAYRWLLFECSDKCVLQHEVAGRARFDIVVDWCLRRPTSGWRQGSQVLKPNSILISSHLVDDEVTAVSALLLGHLQQNLRSLAPGGIAMLADFPAASSQGEDEQVSMAVCSAYCLIVVLSSGSLSSTCQLQVIVDAIGNSVPCVPVFTPNFRLPGPIYFDDELPARFGDEAPRVSDSVKKLLVASGGPFTNFASQSVLDVQLAALTRKVPPKGRMVPPGKSKTGMSLFATELSISILTHSNYVSSNSNLKSEGQITSNISNMLQAMTAAPSSQAPSQAPALDLYCGEILC